MTSLCISAPKKRQTRPLSFLSLIGDLTLCVLMAFFFPCLIILLGVIVFQSFEKKNTPAEA